VKAGAFMDFLTLGWGGVLTGHAFHRLS
jgi:hypothetical protein